MSGFHGVSVVNDTARPRTNQFVDAHADSLDEWNSEQTNDEELAARNSFNTSAVGTKMTFMNQ